MSSHYTAQLWLVVIVYTIFLTGFFPLKPGDSESSTSQDLPHSWNRRVERLVIMVIDALRLDFVVDRAGSESEFKIKYLEEMIQERKAQLVVTRVSPPTVTLPRLKAITTGNIPGFVDIIRNFDTKELLEDSLINQWRLHERNITMFGDDTWTKLFPGQFLREDPVSSFFVSDYTEVDQNVTRHLESEMKAKDWDVLILHYLGLDHIGHVEGPRSSLVQPKLDEMSAVISQIWSSLREGEGERDMMVVLGDHGMADGGGHGGASQAETLVPLVLLREDVLDTEDTEEEALQVDLVPTLAALTGVPVPRWSLGTVLQSGLTGLGQRELLDIVRHNAEHLQRIASVSGRGCDQAEDMLEEAGRMLEEERAIELLRESSRLLQGKIVSEATKYDLYTIILSIFILFLLLITNLLTVLTFKHSSLISLTLIMTALNCSHCLLCSFSKSELCSPSPGSVGVLLISAGLFITSLDSLLTVKMKDIRGLSSLKPGGIESTFLLLSCAASVLSLLSSSFIEEEHQTSYFLLVTFLCLLAREGGVMSVSVMLLQHKVLRNFNQTGDKWQNLPDITDWLNTTQHQHFKLMALSLSLLGIWLVLQHSDNVLGKLLKTVFVITLYLQKCSKDQNNFAQFNYVLSVLNLLCCSKQRLHSLFDTVLMLVTILQSDTNLSVVCLLLSQLHLVKPFLVQLEQPYQGLAVILLSRASYFYFGNSNSLATIDVGAGYVGLVSYNPAIITVLLAIHTYSGPVLVILFMSRFLEVNSLVKSHYFFLLTELVIFCLLSTALRYHLFVWTVFSPKLLYEGMNLVVMTFILNLISVLQ